MVATAIIVFREVLEAALVVGIVLAAARGVPRRGVWVTSGIAAGVVGATIVAACAGAIAAAVNGIGQELFNAGILFTAVAMLGWHNIWMNRHGRELAATAALLGKAVLGGSRPLYALALVVGIAVLREGSEIVLFLYGIAIASGVGALSMLAGGILGLAGGAAIGTVIYFGLLAIPLRRLFRVTSWLILLLAAGMASQGAAFLMQANLLPSLGNGLWDTSSILSENS
ncbi:MAG TPA: FTR1 family protein, partial [Stellaceae bacterium]|nr:FTR1 family protein [Stellaceae bacterium]